MANGDDPTKLVFTAETSDVQSKVKTLRQVIDEFTASLGLSGDQAKRVGDTYEQIYTKLNVDAPTAEKALAAVRAEHEKSGPAVQKHDFNIKSLAQSFLGVVSVAAIVRANLADIRAELEPLVEELQEYAVENGASKTAVDLFSNSIEMMLDPMTIAKNLISNFKIAWGEFERGVGLSTEATGKLSDELERVNRLLAKHQADIQQETQSLKDRTDAIAIATFIEERHGGVTAKTREEVEKLVAEYDKTGEIPPKLDRIRKSLGILTEAEKEAASEAKRRGEEQERAATKAAKAAEAERSSTEAIRDASAARRDSAAPTREATAAVEEHAEALQLEAAAANEAAAAERARLDEIEEIRRKQAQQPLDPGELNRLFELESGAPARENEWAVRAEDDVLAARDSVGEFGKELTKAEEQAEAAFNATATGAEEAWQTVDQITESLEAAREAGLDLGDVDLGGAYRESEADQRVWVEQTKYNAEKAAQNLEDGFVGPVRETIPLITNEAAKAADEMVRIGEDGAKSIVGVGQAVGDAGEKVEQLGQAAATASEQLNFAKAREDVEWLEEHVPTLIGLVEQLAAAAAAVELGGPADESEANAQEAN